MHSFGQIVNVTPVGENAGSVDKEPL
jgi:hypothetical protein